MNFGEVLETIQYDEYCRRKCWSKHEYIHFSSGNVINIANSDMKINISCHIDMITEDGNILIGWTPNQIDMFSSDWEVYNG